MPGSPLAIQYPVTGDSTKDVLTKFSDNFQVLETDLEAKVTQADIEIGGALEMHDHPLTEVGSLLMTDNIGASSVAGTLMYATGKWYVADAVGAIQLTDGSGGISASGVGGIGGDYGGTEPALVSYSAIDSTYSFTTDPGVYADVNMLSVTFPTAGGSLTLVPDAALTGAKTITISAPPASGTGMLTLTSAGVMEADAAVTNAQTFSDVTVTDLTATNLLRPALTRAIPLVHLEWTNAAPTVTRAYGRVTTITALTEFLIPIELEVGEKLTNISCYVTRSGTAGTVTLRAFKVSTAGTVSHLGAAVTSAAVSSSFTVSFPYAGAACAAGETFGAYLELPTNGDYVTAITYTRQSTP